MSQTFSENLPSPAIVAAHQKACADRRREVLEAARTLVLFGASTDELGNVERNCVRRTLLGVWKAVKAEEQAALMLSIESRMAEAGLGSVSETLTQS